MTAILTSVPKPPSSKTSSGWPAIEDMRMYFKQVRAQIDEQLAMCRHEVDRYYPHPRASEIIERARKAAMADYDRVVKNYEKVFAGINPSIHQLEFNMRMLKFFSIMGDNFKRAMQVTSVNSVMRELYSLKE